MWWLHIFEVVLRLCFDGVVCVLLQYATKVAIANAVNEVKLDSQPVITSVSEISTVLRDRSLKCSEVYNEIA